MTDKASHLRPGGAHPGSLRFDASRNRTRIVDAARQEFSEHGLDVPVAAIAKRAGVGTATLYRRFPTREALVSVILEEQLDRYGEVVSRALDHPDPGVGFTTLIRHLFIDQAQARDFALALTARVGSGELFEQARSGVERQLRFLVERAQTVGAVRPDVSWTDIVVLMAASDGIRSALEADASRVASARSVALFLRAVLVAPDDDLLAPPLQLD
jgi:AcrR family transcriptional regulator